MLLELLQALPTYLLTLQAADSRLSETDSCPVRIGYGSFFPSQDGISLEGLAAPSGQLFFLLDFP